MRLDAVIECCDAMQKLREAICSFKQSADSKDMAPMQRAAALNRGTHYLNRY